MSTDYTNLFSDRADNYVRARPGYPAHVLALIREDTGFEGSRIVADVGSGTGLFSRLLLDDGHRVLAVEPNADMRRAAENELSSNPRFQSIPGRAEATTLSEACVDLVTSAQAFHWFDADATRKEWTRILRPPGWVALVWNDRRIEGDPFSVAHEEFLNRWGAQDYAAVRRSWDVRPLVAGFFSASGWSEHHVPNFQVLDGQGFEERLLSSSFLPRPNDPGHAEMLRTARTLFDTHEVHGTIRIEYDTRLIVGCVGP